MIRILSASAAGLVFGIGLSVAQITNPAKVKNFFDLAGTWDPSLVFAMLGAAAVTFEQYRHALGHRLATRIDYDAKAYSVSSRLSAGDVL